MSCNVVTDCGADPTGVSDSLPAFQAALAAVASSPPGSPYDGEGGHIVVPKGTYRLSGKLVINKHIRLEGEAAGARQPAVWLLFDGVSLTSTDTTRAACIEVVGYDGVNPERGDGTRIENIGIEGPGRHATLGGKPITGVYAWSPITLDHITVRRCSGEGVMYDGRDGRQSSIPTAIRNCNAWRMSALLVEDCEGTGVFVEGQDANAGIAVGLNVLDCTVGGIHDSSFLNSTWVACSVHMPERAENPGRGFQSSGATNKSLFLGCYDEMGGLPIKLSDRSVWIGGVHGNGFEPTQAFILSNNTFASQLTFQNNNAARTRGVELGVGGNEGRTFLRFGLHEGEEDLTVRDDGGWLQLFRAHGRSSMEITGTGALLNGREVPEGTLLMAGHFFGGRGTARWRGIAMPAADGSPQVPTFGPVENRPWADGDLLDNQRPTTHVGWARVDGEWKKYGPIEP